MQKELIKLDCPLSIHAEGPIWHARRNSVFWVDILGHQLFEYQWDIQETLTYDQLPWISAVLPVNGSDTQVLISIRGGLALYDLEKKTYRMLDDLQIDWENMRCNDAGIDPDGIGWISTTHMDHLPELGSVYRIQEHGKCVEVLKGISISNGPCWSEDGKTMLHTDTANRQITVYDVIGGFSFKLKNQLEIPASLGFPDGMTLDKSGVLWVALWGGFGLVGIDFTSGKMLHKIELPVPQVTSCTFVGADLNELFITTSAKGLSPAELQQYPLSGAVFLIKMNAEGLSIPACNLTT